MLMSAGILGRFVRGRVRARRLSECGAVSGV